MRPVIAVIAASFASTAIAQTVLVDPALPKYTRSTGVSGNIQSIGSDTMNNLMTQWGEEFNKSYPNVQIEVEGKGSSTAPPALRTGTATFGPMSRAMKQKEVDDFEESFGYKPVVLRTAIDALAVFVHKDCPLDEISLDELAMVFSVDGEDNMTWGDLGVTDPVYRNKGVSLFGRNSASGTYGFFKKHALNNNDFRDSVKEQPGSAAVTQAVALDKFAMGYSGLAYKTAGVKVLRISLTSDDEAFEPTAENAYMGDYPLARFLYLALNYPPRTDLEPLRAEFIKMVFSKEGQSVVLKENFFPVSAEIAREDMRRVGIDPNF